ncbi:MAG: hypothetical protein M1541_21490 [Acidobacteria bacterium]|nr:hypothetical protein [Acidobacteriota bacterium]
MANLMASLLNTTGALAVYTKALDVTQNNVVNASTPGFARQRLNLVAAPYDPDRGGGGGVRAGDVQSARNRYAEEAVRGHVSEGGRLAQQAESLAAIESGFDISGESGIPAALNDLFQSFSAWSVDPDGSGARQNVLDRAGDLASAMRAASAKLDADTADVELGLRGTVNNINRIAADIRGFNVEIQQGTRNDAGLDATKNAALEELAEYVDFKAIDEPDGSVTVLLGGETPLVIGDKQYELPQPDHAGTPPTARYSGLSRQGHYSPGVRRKARRAARSAQRHAPGSPVAAESAGEKGGRPGQ